MSRITSPEPPIESISRRRILNHAAALTAGGVLSSTLPGCGSDSATQDVVYVGEVRFQGRKGLVAFHIDGPGAASSGVRAYACDGLPSANGGYALWFVGTVADGVAGLTAVASTAKLTYVLAGGSVAGVVTLAGGGSSAFTTTTKTDGSGIYDVVVDSDTSIKGSSTRGDVLDMTQNLLANNHARIAGTITPVSGARVNVTSFGSSLGLYPPDAFTAVALVNGAVVIMSGRSGIVRSGQPGNNIINWDVE